MKHGICKRVYVEDAVCLTCGKDSEMTVLCFQQPGEGWGPLLDDVDCWCNSCGLEGVRELQRHIEEVPLTHTRLRLPPGCDSP